MKSAMRTKSAHGLCSLNCNGSFVVGFFFGGGVLFTFSEKIEWRILLHMKFC